MLASIGQSYSPILFTSLRLYEILIVDLHTAEDVCKKRYCQAFFAVCGKRTACHFHRNQGRAPLWLLLISRINQTNLSLPNTFAPSMLSIEPLNEPIFTKVLPPSVTPESTIGTHCCNTSALEIISTLELRLMAHANFFCWYIHQRQKLFLLSQHCSWNILLHRVIYFIVVSIKRVKLFENIFRARYCYII